MSIDPMSVNFQRILEVSGGNRYICLADNMTFWFGRKWLNLEGLVPWRAIEIWYFQELRQNPSESIFHYRSLKIIFPKLSTSGFCDIYELKTFSGELWEKIKEKSQEKECKTNKFQDIWQATQLGKDKKMDQILRRKRQKCPWGLW